MIEWLVAWVLGSLVLGAAIGWVLDQLGRRGDSPEARRRWKNEEEED